MAAGWLSPPNMMRGILEGGGLISKGRLTIDKKNYYRNK